MEKIKEIVAKFRELVDELDILFKETPETPEAKFNSLLKLLNSSEWPDLDPVFMETSGFFIFRKELLSQNRRIGDSPFMVEVDRIEAIDIDYAEDFEFAQRVIG